MLNRSIAYMALAYTRRDLDLGLSSWLKTLLLYFPLYAFD